MVAAWHLHYLVETDVVELASLLLMDPIDCHDELTIVAPLAILLAFPPLSVVPSLVCGLSLSLALLLIEVCSDGLLFEGMAHCKVE